jgi:predicted nuclease of predicted toxin-antitoxin system
MRFKVDENLHPDAADLLRSAGHDAMTVYDQGLRGHTDEDIATICQREQRAIVTLDLDFSNIRQYPPEDYPGIIVLRLEKKSRPFVLNALTQILPLLATEPLAGHLWIVEEQRVRIRQGGTRGAP